MNIIKIVSSNDRSTSFMECPKCGKKIADDSRYCEFCGVRVYSVRSKWKKYALPIVASVLLVVTVVALSINYLGNNKSDLTYVDDYVDLGLPSGTLWATCNVGASKPEGYGNYYAWGETTTKTVYNWSTYKWTNGSSSSLTKYTGSSSAELELADDAAYVNWGKNWRVPSEAQFEELINDDYTTTTWTSINGIYGRKITSKMPGYTGNSIFLPAAGYYNGSSLSYAGSDGLYWSNVSDTYGALYLGFNSGNIGTNYSIRVCGQSVRPVRFSE